MNRNVLAAIAAACTLAATGANASATASNDEFTVTTDQMGLFGDVSIQGGEVSALSSFAGAGASVIPMQVGSDFMLSFQAAPGFEIEGYELSFQVTGGAGTYSGPSYGSAPAAYATFGSPWGSAAFFGDSETYDFTAVLPAGDVSGDMSFYAFPSSFCIVPIAVCQDTSQDTVMLSAGVALDYFRVKPIIHPTEVVPPAGPVDEPSSLALVGLAAAGLAARRRAVSARGTA